MKVVSTFAGCGGSSLGYEQAGCEVVAAVEWDAHAVECYRLNHPDTIVLQRDVADVTGAEILEATGLDVGELDVLDGSPPCQGFSAAGSRILADPRNTLFQQHLRLVDELRPRHVVIENVAGMVRGRMRQVAAEIVSALKDRGYAVAAGILRADLLGVAQLRSRVFFIASRVGQPELPRPTTHPIAARVALRGIDPGEIHPLKARTQVQWFAHNLRPGENGASCWERHGLSARRDFTARMLHPDRPCWTILKVGSVHMFHWRRRLITVREALVLTGFPVNYQLTRSRSARWARIGNSVAPPMIREIVRQSLAPLEAG